MRHVFFFLFLIQNIMLCTQRNSLNKMVLLSIRNICLLKLMGKKIINASNVSLNQTHRGFYFRDSLAFIFNNWAEHKSYF